MGAQHSRDIHENEFVFENPYLPTTTTFHLPPKEENGDVSKQLKKSEKENNKPESVSTFPSPLKSKILEEENALEDEKTNNDNESMKYIIEENNDKSNNTKEDVPINEIKNEVKNESKEELKEEFIEETNKIKEETKNVINEEIKKEIKEDIKGEIKKDKKKKFKEEPLPTEDTYKPLNLEKADLILSPEILEEIIEEHVKEEIYSIQNEQKIKNFKRDKLLERTINTIKYGNSSFNYKDINDKYRKSQRKVLECMSNNESCTLSERDISCYQEFEEFKDNIRMLYKKYYSA